MKFNTEAEKNSLPLLESAHFSLIQLISQRTTKNSVFLMTPRPIPQKIGITGALKRFL